jgi:hypothetical protein
LFLPHTETHSTAHISVTKPTTMLVVPGRRSPPCQLDLQVHRTARSGHPSG